MLAWLGTRPTTSRAQVRALRATKDANARIGDLLAEVEQFLGDVATLGPHGQRVQAGFAHARSA